MNRNKFSPLFCDLYHLTMAQAMFDDNSHNNVETYEMFIRKTPFNGSYLLTAGLGEVLEWLNDWHFEKEDIDYLREQGFKEEFLNMLSNAKLNIDMKAFREGEIVFPNEPNGKHTIYDRNGKHEKKVRQTHHPSDHADGSGKKQKPAIRFVRFQQKMKAGVRDEKEEHAAKQRSERQVLLVREQIKSALPYQPPCPKGAKGSQKPADHPFRAKRSFALFQKSNDRSHDKILPIRLFVI